jgi:hypothetical protein
MCVLKLTLTKNIFLQIFLQFHIFSVKSPNGPTIGSGRAQSCQELTWQLPSKWVTSAFGRMPYKLRPASFSPLRHISLLFLSFLAFWFDFLMFSHEFSAYFFLLSICAFCSPFRELCAIFYILFNLF